MVARIAVLNQLETVYCLHEYRWMKIGRFVLLNYIIIGILWFVTLFSTDNMDTLATKLASNCNA